MHYGRGSKLSGERVQMSGATRETRAGLAMALLLPVVVCLLGMAPVAWAAAAVPVPILQPVSSNYADWGLGAAMAFDPDTAQLVLTGGVGFTLTCGCDGTAGTWVWNGTDFVAVAPAGGGSIYGHLIYDAATHQLLRVGGTKADQSTPADNFAAWTGTAWTPLHPVHSPPPRQGESVAYDAQLRQLLVFGGFSTTTRAHLADTWSWDGTDWIELHPAASPPARGDAAMAYDESSGKLVLYGGLTLGPTGLTYHSDTWFWTGTTWTAVAPAANPGMLSSAVMTYDPALHRLLLFGGVRPAGALSSEFWSWNGMIWALVPSLVAPTNMFGASMAFDPALGHLVLLAPDRDKVGGILHTLRLVAAPATSRVVASSNAVTVGQAVTLTASVLAGAYVVPTGTVSFLDGTTPIAGCTNLAVSGAACTYIPAGGTHTVSAKYVAAPGFVAGRAVKTTVTVAG